MKKMNIAVFTISLGKYNIFFKELYESVNSKFLPDHNKTFFIFTDTEFENKSNLVQIPQKKLGWPFDTMNRFHFMCQIKETLLEYDYVFFFNINMKVIKEINDEILPSEDNGYLMGCTHPWFSDVDINLFPYERNAESNCYIPFDEGKIYYQGCFNGGRTKEFLEMAEILKNNTDSDIENGIIPIWHDESMLNWYYHDKNPLTLPYTYIYPESLKLKGEPIMIQRDKSKYMDYEKLRK
jgi:hypothetical protein